jgi:hypothetical protein
MVLTYDEWLENLFRDLKNRGTSATLESDGSIVCEKDGHKQVAAKVAAYSKYREYLVKYPDPVKYQD